jgi:hypothetical protein
MIENVVRIQRKKRTVAGGIAGVGGFESRCNARFAA